MKIGIFDSGLGGLVIAKAVIKHLPQYDYCYLGDTKNLPYGDKSQKQIYGFTVKSLKVLFEKDCKLVVIACNTASAKALRKIQREFLPRFFPDRKVLGVIVPTVEEVASGSPSASRVGIISTLSTARSHVYKKEIKKINPKIKVFEQAAPKLVPLIENNTLELIDGPLEEYLSRLLKHNIDSLVLGCTHYPILKDRIQKIAGSKIKIYSQEDIIPKKLENYLKEHREIRELIFKNKQREFLVTKVNPQFKKVAERLFGKKIKLILCS